ncbi:hypothetical protein SeMB42_g02211, partial [Synchytrium endobioticum]
MDCDTLKEVVKRKPVLEFLVLLCKMLQLGTAPGKALLTASRLIALNKEDGGVRPIAVGEIIYRLMAKVVLKKSLRPNMLAEFQLGVKSKGGVEPIIHLINDVMEGKAKGYNYITTVDFENAFNSTDRGSIARGCLKHASEFYKPARWVYDEPAALVMVDGSIIESSEGVRQGDPMGPLLFSLAIREALEKLKRQLDESKGPDDPPTTIMAYLDDVYILSGSKLTPEVIADHLVEAPVKINVRKTKTYSVDEIRTTGLQVLGSFVGPLDAHLTDEYKKIDDILLEMVKYLQGDSTATDLDRDIVALPVRLGGLGIVLYEELMDTSYLQSRDNAFEVLINALSDTHALFRSPSPHAPAVREAEDDESLEEQTPRVKPKAKYKNKNHHRHQARLTKIKRKLSTNQEAARQENAS